jgi:calpain family cysteine protease
MLGNSSGGSAGAGFGHTSIGIRGYTSITPATTNKTTKSKKGAEKGSGKVDRVVREEANGMLAAINPDERRDREGAEELALPAGHSAAQKRLEGRAFRIDDRGRTLAPVYGDVDQGNLGDSWLMASCAAVAHAQPAKLLRRVTPNGDGTFNVKLGREDFRVEPEFSGEGYADPMPNGQRDTLWVALVEKAFAERESGSYANLEHGSPGRALEALTGSEAVRSTITEQTKLDRLYEKLRDGQRAGAAMVLRSRDHAVCPPLDAEHNYAVLDVYERGGERFAKVYNPWGTKQNSRTLDSMTYELKLETIHNECEALYVSRA